jgi:hypothetical protein
MRGLAKACTGASPRTSHGRAATMRLGPSLGARGESSYNNVVYE